MKQCITDISPREMVHTAETELQIRRHLPRPGLRHRNESRKFRLPAKTVSITLLRCRLQDPVLTGLLLA